MSGDGRDVVYGVEANTTIYTGGMVGLDASGYAVPMSAVAGLKCVGVSMGMQYPAYYGQNAVNGAVAGAVSVIARRGVFPMNTGSGNDQVVQSQVGGIAYALDDNTVSGYDGTLTQVTAAALTTPASGSPQVMPLGHNWIQRGSLSITNSAGSTTYVEGTDYSVNYDAGLIAFLAGGAIAGGAVSIKATYKWSTGTRSACGRIVLIDPATGLIWVDSRILSAAAL